MQFDYVKFIDEGYAAQQKYAAKIGEWGPEDLAKMTSAPCPFQSESVLKHRYGKMIEHFGHLTEESIEARVYVPRRSWKNNEPSFLDSESMRKEFIAEMYDILLFHRAILAYAGVSGEEFAKIAEEKQAYNQKRKDHNVNGDDVANSLPVAELHGDCDSANFVA
jgi:hypothetical protein